MEIFSGPYFIANFLNFQIKKYFFSKKLPGKNFACKLSMFINNIQKMNLVVSIGVNPTFKVIFTPLE